MNAALYESPRRFRVTSRDLRKPGPGEVVLKVDACGICGTDVHIVAGESRSRPPVVLGHEFTGVVEEGAGSWAPGTAAAVDPNISCGACTWCRRGLVHLCANLRALGVDIDGGLAQYCIVPAGQLHPVPAGMTVEQRAFIEPLSCCVHGIDRANVAAGDAVLILGGGTIGLIMLQLARAAGAARTIVVEPLKHKQEIARALGADAVVAPAEAPDAVRDLPCSGADVVIECAGRKESAAAAPLLARRGGTILIFGVAPSGETIPMEPHLIYERELTIAGSYVNPHTFSRSITLLAAGTVRVDRFRIDRFPLDGAPEALAAQREGRTIKSIVEPNR